MDDSDVVRQLPGPCHPGRVITVDGFIPPETTRFSINLSTSPTLLGGDIALHVNPRFDQDNVLVRNSFENGEWQVEERGGPPAPVQKNASFRCTITSLEDRFMIGFNGQNCWEFHHRFCHDIANWLIIRGVQVNNVNSSSQSTLPVPGVVRQLPSPCHPGLVITVDGFIPAEYDRYGFSINLSTTPTYLGGDIAIHVNPRFDEGNVLVLNSFERCGWKTEERNGPVVPLQRNAKFKCTITSLQDKFLIDFNGQNSWEFRHRFSQERVNWLIIGGAQVNDVNFTG